MRSAPPFWFLPVLLCATFLVYLPVLSHSFVFDDVVVIGESELVRDWRNLPHLLTRSYFPLSREYSYRPVVTLSYALEQALWPDRAGLFHLTNLLLHLGVLAAIFWLARRLFGDGAACLPPLLLAWHPSLSEAVNAVGFREDLLAALGGVLALRVALGGLRLARAESGPPLRQRSATGRAALACLLYLVALFSKEMVLTLPLLFGAAVVLLDGRPRRRAWGMLGAFLFTTLAYGVVRFVVMTPPAAKPIAPLAGSLAAGVGVMIRVLAFYVQSLVLPLWQNADYATPGSALAPLVVSLAVLGGLALVLLWSRRRQALVAVGLAWFALALLPVMNVVPLENPLADRYLYFPGIGFALASGAGLWRLWEALQRRWRVALLACLALTLLGTAALTRQRSFVWRSDAALWSDALRRSPGKARPWNNYGVIAWRREQVARAAYAYRVAAWLEARYADPLRNLALLEAARERPDRAARWLRTALTLDPEHLANRLLYGQYLGEIGSWDAAILAWQQGRYIAYESRPFLEAMVGAAPLRGRPLALLGVQRQLVARAPTDASAINALGSTWYRLGVVDKALAQYQEALRLQPDSLPTRYNLGALAQRQGRLRDAAARYRAILRAHPEHAPSHAALGVVWYWLKQPTRAIAEFSAALRLPSSPSDLDFKLGMALLAVGARQQAARRLAAFLAAGGGTAAQRRQASSETERLAPK
ncbi:MAG: tetratricopeptide repeat protein [Candidatus Tectomicrobia bacterium]|nr:tetratricopeptide repeat protein [Candidatus Tectomicrobia bacterium]